jgi:sigma-E factor negative regulatory protein RseC
MAIQDIGVVTEREGEVVRVRISRGERCAGCSLCFLSSDGKELIAEADDPVGAAPGDTVSMEQPGSHPVRDGFLLFVLPILLLLFGYITGEALGSGPIGLGLGALLLAPVFLFLRGQERRGNHRMQITQVLERAAANHRG